MARSPPDVGGNRQESAPSPKALLAHLGLRHYFSAVVAADHVVNHKPAPDTFLLCAERMGASRAGKNASFFENMPTLVCRRRSARNGRAVDVRLL